MSDISEFEKYLIYDNFGQPLGIRQDTPEDIKRKYRIWYEEEQDKIRLAELFDIKS